MFDGQDLDAPGPIEAHLAHGADEADDILGALADERAAVAGVLEQGADGFQLGIAELDPEGHARVETGDEVLQRGVGPEDVPEVHDQPGGRVTGRPDQVGALGHGADEGERQRLERDAGADGRRFVGDAAERFDEGRDVVHRGSELGPDLDERRPELVRRLEQQLPGPAPGEVVLPPPAGGELDFDVPKAGGLDLGLESGESRWSRGRPAGRPGRSRCRPTRSTRRRVRGRSRRTG